jgi:PadR family transcriptional regulator PadR
MGKDTPREPGVAVLGMAVALRWAVPPPSPPLYLRQIRPLSGPIRLQDPRPHRVHVYDIAVRMTANTVKVLAAFLERPRSDHYGYDLMRATGLKSGGLYPILERLHREGLVEREWEPPPGDGRPPRRYYRLTAAGARAGRAGVADAARGQAVTPVVRPA